ncbi:alpha/beta hydrolase [Microcella humidisoli]|uniref:Alpha/beta hydrolase n=1 Tax=Microcella humidisoli TaxID=2963406 RepID=A0ABY5G000_9MICO|nr:alpha/beta hydrolase [Microcella humidisoli]UTT63276.1 alpha/beta hydrolase [Microcella humidisoli]
MTGSTVALPEGGLAAWPHVFVPGEPGAPVLLTLHGTGGTETEITALATPLDPRASVLSPRGRVREGGASRWFRRMGEGVFDVDDVIVRAGELAAFITAAREEYALADAPLTAVGFSNGANIALATALLHPGVLTRVVAFSGMYPFGDRDPIGDATGVELLLLNGTGDPMAPAGSVDVLERTATQHGASVTRISRPGGHGIDSTELQAAQEWLAR